MKRDVLSLRPVRALVRWRLFPVVLQLVLLVVMALLVVKGLGFGLDMSADDLMTFRKTNVTTLVVWGLWWPSMIVIALLLGRAWCMVCPMELVNRLGDAIARRAGWRRARMGGLLRAGWGTLALYLALQLLVAGVSLHRLPHYTALMVSALFGLALVAGLVFRDLRSFCSGICPASALLSVYGRFTPLQLSPKEPAVCADCETRDCVNARNRHRFDRRSCPSLLRPYAREPSDGCVMCLQCAKVCPQDNMGFGFISPAAPLRRRALLRPFEAGFVMVALGFVTHEVVGEVEWLDRGFHLVPEGLRALWPTVPFGWFEVTWFLVLFPLAAWGVIAGLSYLLGHRSGWRSLLLAAATGAAPVVAVAHFAKAVAKLSSWAGYLPLALHDPAGVATLGHLADHSLTSPSSIFALPLIGWVMLVAIALVAWRSTRWIRDLPRTSLIAASAGLGCVAAMFTGLMGLWAWGTVAWT